MTSSAPTVRLCSVNSGRWRTTPKCRHSLVPSAISMFRTAPPRSSPTTSMPRQRRASIYPTCVQLSCSSCSPPLPTTPWSTTFLPSMTTISRRCRLSRSTTLPTPMSPFSCTSIMSRTPSTLSGPAWLTFRFRPRMVKALSSTSSGRCALSLVFSYTSLTVPADASGDARQLV